MLDAEAQGMRPRGFALEIFGAPDLAVALIDFNRLVEFDRRRGIAVVDGGRVNERLEGGTWLAHRLRRAIEFRLVERKAADHGEDAAGEGVHRHTGPRNFRDLPQ